MFITIIDVTERDIKSYENKINRFLRDIDNEEILKVIAQNL